MAEKFKEIKKIPNDRLPVSKLVALLNKGKNKEKYKIEYKTKHKTKYKVKNYEGKYTLPFEGFASDVSDVKDPQRHRFCLMYSNKNGYYYLFYRENKWSYINARGVIVNGEQLCPLTYETQDNVTLFRIQKNYELATERYNPKSKGQQKWVGAQIAYNFYPDDAPDQLKKSILIKNLEALALEDRLLRDHIKYGGPDPERIKAYIDIVRSNETVFEQQLPENSPMKKKLRTRSAQQFTPDLDQELDDLIRQDEARLQASNLSREERNAVEKRLKGYRLILLRNQRSKLYYVNLIDYFVKKEKELATLLAKEYMSVCEKYIKARKKQVNEGTIRRLNHRLDVLEKKIFQTDIAKNPQNSLYGKFKLSMDKVKRVIERDIAEFETNHPKIVQEYNKNKELKLKTLRQIEEKLRTKELDPQKRVKLLKSKENIIRHITKWEGDGLYLEYRDLKRFRSQSYSIIFPDLKLQDLKSKPLSPEIFNRLRTAKRTYSHVDILNKLPLTGADYTNTNRVIDEKLLRRLPATDIEAERKLGRTNNGWKKSKGIWIKDKSSHSLITDDPTDTLPTIGSIDDGPTDRIPIGSSITDNSIEELRNSAFTSDATDRLGAEPSKNHTIIQQPASSSSIPTETLLAMLETVEQDVKKCLGKSNIWHQFEAGVKELLSPDSNSKAKNNFLHHFEKGLAKVITGKPHSGYIRGRIKKAQIQAKACSRTAVSFGVAFILAVAGASNDAIDFITEFIDSIWDLKGAISNSWGEFIRKLLNTIKSTPRQILESFRQIWPAIWTICFITTSTIANQVLYVAHFWYGAIVGFLETMGEILAAGAFYGGLAEIGVITAIIVAFLLIIWGLYELNKVLEKEYQDKIDRDKFYEPHLIPNPNNPVGYAMSYSVFEQRQPIYHEDLATKALGDLNKERSGIGFNAFDTKMLQDKEHLEFNSQPDLKPNTFENFYADAWMKAQKKGDFYKRNPKRAEALSALNIISQNLRKELQAIKQTIMPILPDIGVKFVMFELDYNCEKYETVYKNFCADKDIKKLIKLVFAYKDILLSLNTPKAKNLIEVPKSKRLSLKPQMSKINFTSARTLRKSLMDVYKHYYPNEYRSKNIEHPLYDSLVDYYKAMAKSKLGLKRLAIIHNELIINFRLQSFIYHHQQRQKIIKEVDRDLMAILRRKVPIKAR